jgi:hypothetical protein
VPEVTWHPSTFSPKCSEFLDTERKRTKEGTAAYLDTTTHHPYGRKRSWGRISGDLNQ